MARKSNDGIDAAGAIAPAASNEAAELQPSETAAVEKASLDNGNSAPADETAALAVTAPTEAEEPQSVGPELKPTTRSLEMVRYRVLSPVFVNGSLVDPKGRNDVYVRALPGLEGTALKLDPQRDAAEPQGGGDKDGKAGSAPN